MAGSGDPFHIKGRCKLKITVADKNTNSIHKGFLSNQSPLLKEGKGVNIYTHGEMLPAHGYPKLKAYEHLVGNYGGAWQDQRKEFDAFPGAILMTTNCIQKPAETYNARIFTRGLVGWPGVAHIADRDFTPVIDAALAADGFAEDAPEKTITVGFAREAVLGVADKVIEAVKAGAIKHFFLIGGCDGAKSGRNYYTELAESVPKDCVILTLACGKYRFNKLDFGDIGGIPRLLDVGHTAGTFLTDEFGFQASRALLLGLRVVCLLSGFVLPALIVARLAEPAMLFVAVVLALFGAVVERWLFFAEAQHVVRLYHGQPAT